jgi:hypothetical protein
MLQKKCNFNTIILIILEEVFPPPPRKKTAGLSYTFPLFNIDFTSIKCVIKQATKSPEYGQNHQKQQKISKTAKNAYFWGHRNTSHTSPAEVINVRVPRLMK